MNYIFNFILAIQPTFKNWVNFDNGYDLAPSEIGMIIFMFKHLSIKS